MPDWYPLIVAAKELGVPPWELERQPTYWRERALTFHNARLKIEADLAKHQK